MPPQTAKRVVVIEVDATKALRSLNAIQKSSAGAERQLSLLSRQAKAAGNFLKSAFIGGLLLTGLNRLGGAFKATADAAANLRAQLGAAAGGPQESAVVFQELFSIAQRLGAPIDELGFSFQRLANAVPNASLGELTFSLETVTQVLATTGASVQATNAVLLQLSQGLGAGALRNDEFRSVLENSPQLLRAWAIAIGRGTESLTKLRDENVFTTESFIKNQKEIRRVSEELIGITKPADTFGRALVRIRNEAVKAFLDVGSENSPLNSFTSALNLLADVTGPAIIFVLTSVGTLTNALADILNGLGGAISLAGQGLKSLFIAAGGDIDPLTEKVGVIESLFRVQLPLTLKAGIILFQEFGRTVGQTFEFIVTEAKIHASDLGSAWKLLTSDLKIFFLDALAFIEKQFNRFNELILKGIDSIRSLLDSDFVAPNRTPSVTFISDALAEAKREQEDLLKSTGDFGKLIAQNREEYAKLPGIVERVNARVKETEDSLRKGLITSISGGDILNRRRGTGNIGTTEDAATARKLARELEKANDIRRETLRLAEEQAKVSSQEISLIQATERQRAVLTAQFAAEKDITTTRNKLAEAEAEGQKQVATALRERLTVEEQLVGVRIKAAERAFDAQQLENVKDSALVFKRSAEDRAAAFEQEIKLTGLSTTASARLTAQFEVENEVRDLNRQAIDKQNEGLQIEAQQLREQAKLLQNEIPIRQARAVAIAEAQRAPPTIGKILEDGFNNVTDNLSDNFGDFFKDIFRGGIADAKDFITSLRDTLLDGLAEIASEIIKSQFKSTITGLLSGGGGTSGGGGGLSSLFGSGFSLSGLFGGGGSNADVISQVDSFSSFGKTGAAAVGGGFGGVGLGLGLGGILGSLFADSGSGTSLASPLDPLVDSNFFAQQPPTVTVVNEGPPLEVTSTSIGPNGDYQLVVQAAVQQTQQKMSRDQSRGYGGFTETLARTSNAGRNV